MQAWQEIVPLFESNPSTPFASIFVPTAETTCAAWFVRTALQHCASALLVGPTGAGKTAVMQSVLASMPASELEAVCLALTARTSAAAVQGAIEAELDKNVLGSTAKRTSLRVAAGHQVAVFVDDLNMPAREEFGAQPALELLRLLQARLSWLLSAGHAERRCCWIEAM